MLSLWCSNSLESSTRAILTTYCRRNKVWPKRWTMKYFRVTKFPFLLSPVFLLCSLLCSVFCASQWKKRRHKDESGFPAAVIETLAELKHFSDADSCCLIGPLTGVGEGYCCCGFACIIHSPPVPGIVENSKLYKVWNNNGWELYHSISMTLTLLWS